MKYSDLKVKARAMEDTYVCKNGEWVEGYLNSWNLAETYTMQVEGCIDIEVEGCSGIFIMNVVIDIATLSSI